MRLGMHSAVVVTRTVVGMLTCWVTVTWGMITEVEVVCVHFPQVRIVEVEVDDTVSHSVTISSAMLNVSTIDRIKIHRPDNLIFKNMRRLEGKLSRTNSY